MTDDTLRAVAGEEWERVRKADRFLCYHKERFAARDALIAKLVAAVEERDNRRCGKSLVLRTRLRLTTTAGGCEHPRLCYAPRCFDTPLSADFACRLFAARDRKEQP